MQVQFVYLSRSCPSISWKLLSVESRDAPKLMSQYASLDLYFHGWIQLTKNTFKLVITSVYIPP